MQESRDSQSGESRRTSRRMFLRRAGASAGIAGIALYVPAAHWLSGRALAQTLGSDAGGLKIGNVAAVTSRGFLRFSDPETGDPSLVVALPDGSYVAYDAVCTHAGCTVNYDAGQRLFVCPCHGSEYDPANNAAVVAGPAPAPLIGIPIRVDGNGDIYAMDVPTPTQTPTQTPTRTPTPRRHKKRKHTTKPKPTPTPTRVVAKNHGKKHRVRSHKKTKKHRSKHA